MNKNIYKLLFAVLLMLISAINVFAENNACIYNLFKDGLSNTDNSERRPLPKPDIKMKSHPKPEHEDILKTIALARLILSPDISIQSPPNLSLEHPEYLNVGLNDWGGISPVTKDFINPENKWPIIKDLNNASKFMGYSLKERLTVYPRFQKENDGFLHKNIFKKMEHLCCDNGLAKEQYIQ